MVSIEMWLQHTLIDGPDGLCGFLEFCDNMDTMRKVLSASIERSKTEFPDTKKG